MLASGNQLTKLKVATQKQNSSEHSDDQLEDAVEARNSVADYESKTKIMTHSIQPT